MVAARSRSGRNRKMFRRSLSAKDAERGAVALVAVAGPRLPWKLGGENCSVPSDADVLRAGQAENVDAELRDGGAVNFREFHFEKNLTGRSRRNFHQAGDFRRDVLDHLENLVGNSGRGDAAGKHDDVFGGFDLHGLVGEDVMNFLAQAERVDVHGDFEVLALIGFVPEQQGDAAGSFAVDEHLVGADHDGLGNRRIRERDALDSGRRSDDQRAADEQVQRLRYFRDLLRLRLRTAARPERYSLAARAVASTTALAGRTEDR